jgi:RHS repeat-associated protein
MRYSCECLISRPDPDAFLGSGLKLEAEYDDGKRPTGFKYANAVTNKEIIGQTSTWNKVDLQTAMTRADASKLSKNFAYDSAYRLRNSVAAQDDTAYEIDGADNIRQVTETKKGVAQTVNHDVNNRNQVITLDGQTLTYDNNGNLVQMTGSGTTTSYIYDYKNQLVKVIGAGTQVEFVYDALGRRVQKKAVYSSSSDVTRYVYDGQQVIEERDGANALKARYAYGNSIDEPVQIERANTAGAMQSYLPMQDTNGNVIGIADGTGKLIEKVQYDAYGKPTFIYDQEPPQVDQVRVVDGKVRIRFSEAVNENTAKEAITLKEGTNELSGSFVFEEEGKLAVFAPGSALATNTQYALEITTGLEDVSGNKLANAFSQPFTYAGADLMVYDRVAPQVEAVKLVGGKLSVEFSEEIDPASAANAIGLTYASGTINGTSTLEDAKSILFTPSSSLYNSTEYILAVKSTVMDLSGKALTLYSDKFIYTGKDLLIYQKPDPSEHQESSIGNNTLFQGREFDTETGLYYFRARYLHPKLGRFLQTDPLGYKDSMNPYQSFGNNPVNFMDPMGELKFKSIMKGVWSFTKTVGKGALFIGGVAVVGTYSAPIALTAGLGFLGKGIIDAASNRIADNQSVLQVAGGTASDISGASGIWAGVANEDIITGEDLNLTEEERAESFGGGTGQGMLLVLGTSKKLNSEIHGRVNALRAKMTRSSNGFVRFLGLKEWDNGTPTAQTHGANQYNLRDIEVYKALRDNADPNSSILRGHVTPDKFGLSWEAQNKSALNYRPYGYNVGEIYSGNVFREYITQPNAGQSGGSWEIYLPKSTTVPNVEGPIYYYDFSAQAKLSGAAAAAISRARINKRRRD